MFNEREYPFMLYHLNGCCHSLWPLLKIAVRGISNFFPKGSASSVKFLTKCKVRHQLMLLTAMLYNSSFIRRTIVIKFGSGEFSGNVFLVLHLTVANTHHSYVLFLGELPLIYI